MTGGNTFTFGAPPVPTGFVFGSTPRPSDSSTLNSSTSPGRKRVSAAQPADKGPAAFVFGGSSTKESFGDAKADARQSASAFVFGAEDSKSGVHGSAPEAYVFGSSSATNAGTGTAGSDAHTGSGGFVFGVQDTKNSAGGSSAPETPAVFNFGSSTTKDSSDAASSEARQKACAFVLGAEDLKSSVHHTGPTAPFVFGSSSATSGGIGAAGSDARAGSSGSVFGTAQEDKSVINDIPPSASLPFLTNGRQTLLMQEFSLFLQHGGATFGGPTGVEYDADATQGQELQVLSANDNGSFAYAGQDIDMADDAADDATNDGNNDMSALRARIAELESETERIWEEAARDRVKGLADLDEVIDEMKAQAALFEAELGQKQALWDRQDAAASKAHRSEVLNLAGERIRLETRVQELEFQLASLTGQGGGEAATVAEMAQTVTALRQQLESSERLMAIALQQANAADAEAELLKKEMKRATKAMAKAGKRMVDMEQEIADLADQTQVLTDRVAEEEAEHKAEMQEVLVAHSRQQRGMERIVELLQAEVLRLRAQPQGQPQPQGGIFLALEDVQQETTIEKIFDEGANAAATPILALGQDDQAQGAAAPVMIEPEDDGDATLPADAGSVAGHSPTPPSAVPATMPAEEVSQAETAFPSQGQLGQTASQITAQIDAADPPPADIISGGTAAMLSPAADTELITAGADAVPATHTEFESSAPRAAAPQSGGVIGAVTNALERSDALQWAVIGVVLGSVACFMPLAVGGMLFNRLRRSRQ